MEDGANISFVTTVVRSAKGSRPRRCPCRTHEKIPPERIMDTAQERISEHIGRADSRCTSAAPHEGDP